MRPIGVPGEIHIGGPGVARGYWNLPDLTADRFLPDRFGTVPGERLYRTGDLGRYLPDGNIEFLGRLDGQVKIRGFRVEPGEIETTLRRHPGVREAIVVSREQPDGAGRHLVAYLVKKGDDPPAAHELRAFLARILPDYMIPSAFVVLDRLPLSPQGKIDRRCLPAPDSMCLESKRPSTPPRTPTEAALVGIFAELLGRDQVGVDEDFFEMGGHSLLAIQAIARVRQVLAVGLSLTCLFATPTAAGLAAAVAARIQAGHGDQPGSEVGGRGSEVGALTSDFRLPPSDFRPLGPVPRGGVYPLLSSQLSIWEILRKFPETPWMNTSRAYRVLGCLDRGALRAALQALVGRHEALRSTIVAVDGAPAQLVLDAGHVEVPLIDLSRLPADARLAEAQRHFRNEARRPYDLAKDLMLRSLLLRTGDDDHVLVLTVNHIVMDARSLTVFNRDLSALYGAFAKEDRVMLPDLPIQPLDFACWERQYSQGEAATRQVAYWRERLEGAPLAPALAGDGPEPEPGNFGSSQQTLPMERMLADRLRSVARAERCTLPMALLAALNVFVHEATGADDILVGTPLEARTRPEVEELIGCFRKRVVLRTDLAGRPSFRELLGRVRNVVAGAYLNLNVSQEIVFPGIGLGDPNYWTNFPVDFNYMESSGHSLTLPGLSLSSLALPENQAGLAALASFRISEKKDGLLLHLRYRHGMYSASKAMEYLNAFLLTLERLAAAPDRQL